MEGIDAPVGLFEFFPGLRLIPVAGDELAGFEVDAQSSFIDFLVFLGQVVEVAAVRSVVGAEPDTLFIFNGIEAASERQGVNGVLGDGDLSLNDLPLNGALGLL